MLGDIIAANIASVSAYRGGALAYMTRSINICAGYFVIDERSIYYGLKCNCYGFRDATRRYVSCLVDICEICATDRYIITGSRAIAPSYAKLCAIKRTALTSFATLIAMAPNTLRAPAYTVSICCCELCLRITKDLAVCDWCECISRERASRIYDRAWTISMLLIPRDVYLVVIKFVLLAEIISA